MKIPSITLLLLLALATFASAQRPGRQDRQLNGYTDRVTADLAANALTKEDADELTREIAHVQGIVDSPEPMTIQTKRDVNRDIAKIEKSLGEKEAAAKANAAAASPTP